MKKIKIISGVYAVRNKIKNKVYIGSSKNLKKRESRHFFLLKKNNHNCKEMQKDYNSIGLENFEFITLITCSEDMLFYYEQQFLDNFKEKYNSSPTAGSQLGFRHTKETKTKISLSKIGVPTGMIPTKEMIENLVKRSLGNEYPSRTYYNFISPEGNIIPEIFNLNKFCRENNLDCAHMTDVYYGKRKSHKGWTSEKNINQN